MGKTRAELRLLREIEAIGGRWAVHYGTGRVVTEAAVKMNGTYYYGRAERNPVDMFNRKLGRIISLGRAWKQFKRSKPTSVHEVPMELRQKEDRPRTDVTA